MNLRPRRAREEGMILVNVLVIVAIASGVILLMTSGQDLALQRSLRLCEAAQAIAVGRGGELSAITALRRDALVAPASDHASEPWGALAETNAPIAGGRFDLAIADAQDRFNLNRLATGSLTDRNTLDRIVAALRLPRDVSTRAAALVAATGPIDDLSRLGIIGLDDATLSRLATMVTVLPGAVGVNINSASEPLLAALIANPVSAAILVSRRARRGGLTPEDLRAASVILPPGTGLTSDLYWVRTRVTIGETSQQATSLIRRRRLSGAIEAAPIARWRGATAPFQAPPLPEPSS